MAAIANQRRDLLGKKRSIKQQNKLMTCARGEFELGPLNEGMSFLSNRSALAEDED